MSTIMRATQEYTNGLDVHFTRRGEHDSLFGLASTHGARCKVTIWYHRQIAERFFIGDFPTRLVALNLA